MASVTSAAVSADVLAKPAARELKLALGDRILAIDEFRGDLAITVERRAWVEAARQLRDHHDCDFKLFLDLCGVLPRSGGSPRAIRGVPPATASLGGQPGPRSTARSSH